eukprot:evm.model.scf_2321.3 EVM.evm.TU.scf_2321.3   scf_2321:21717-24876(+)
MSRYNGALTEPYFEVPCDSRGVDGFLRGSMVGVAGSLYFPGGLLHSAGDTRIPITHQIANSLKVAAFLGAFMGVYSGLSCTFERIRGRRDRWNALAAGSLTGVITASPSKNPRTIFMSAVACGAIGLSVSSFAEEEVPRAMSEACT